MTYNLDQKPNKVDQMTIYSDQSTGPRPPNYLFKSKE